MNMHTAFALQAFKQRVFSPLAPVVRFSTSVQPVSQTVFNRIKTRRVARKSPGVALGIIETPAGEIVLTKEESHNGWSLPGGTVEEGECFRAAFLRETKEELGVVPVSSRLFIVENKTFVSPEAERFLLRLAVFHACIKETVLPSRTKDAEKEGLFLHLFDPRSLPDSMFLNDREKIAAFLENKDAAPIPGRNFRAQRFSFGAVAASCAL